MIETNEYGKTYKQSISKTKQKKFSDCIHLIMTGNLNEQWNSLNKQKKIYTKYLMVRYHNTLRIALQQVIVFGFLPTQVDQITGEYRVETYEDFVNYIKQSKEAPFETPFDKVNLKDLE